MLRQRFDPEAPAGASLFLKREGGRVRPQTLMELLPPIEVSAAKLAPGEQTIVMMAEAKGRLGVLQVIVFEKPSAAAPAAAAPAAEGPALDAEQAALLRKMGRVEEPELARRIQAAAAHPLGSARNPIRVFMPGGEVQYLSRLRCADGRPPAFERVGSLAETVYGSIMEGYDVRCARSQPAKSFMYMDMYHPEHRETAAPEGFTLAPE